MSGSTARRLAAALPLAGFVLALSGPQAGAEDFYKGKSISMIIGSAPGGGFDAYGRIIARHLDRYVPGEPSIVPQNVPGAGGALAGRQAAIVAPQDGTAIGAVHPATVMRPLISKEAGKIKPIKFQFLASANSDVEICFVRTDSPVKKLEDLFTTEIIMGAASEGSSTQEFATITKNLLDAKFRIVAGYKGNADIYLAAQRGEIQGACGISWSSISSRQPEWLASGQIKVIAQEYVEGHPDLDKQGVPLMLSQAKTPEQKEMLELFYSQLVFGRPYVVGPTVPPDRVALLRKAFMATMQDKDFLAEAAKSKLEIQPIDGERIQRLVDKLYAAKPETLAKIRAALGNS